MMNEFRLEKLYKYLELLTKAYFTDDPLNVKQSIEKVMLLIELEINKGYGEEVDE
ncbi:hypothetical protein [Bacillus sp. BP-3]|uniref:hypothetical protein n=1 Tax=Bacillus sp. BP-3 TaxID=3022773 RepID=UPI0023307EE6|nr:hypothetical protein [Bacillus sp. BP-3]MDC2863838.1 hypothetical protein [Bacillus sp. BP-3]